MNIKVYYHSSTGNTKKLAQVIAKGLKIQANQLGDDRGIISEPVDLLFIGDGIYFGKSNKKTCSFIDGLDSELIRNAAVFATYGGNQQAGDEIKELLKKKGIHVLEESFTCKGRAWKLINREHPNDTDLKNAMRYAERMVSRVTDNNIL